MPLTLEVIGRKAAQMGSGVRKVFQGGGTIGRLHDNDWVFPDQYISGRHARISCVNGCYLIEDTSTNGVFINSPQNRIPRGQPQPLRDGDTVYIDDYEVRVRLEGDTAAFEPVAGIGGLRHPGAVREPYISEDPFSAGERQSFRGERQAGADEIDPMRLLGLEDPPARRQGPSAAGLAGNSPLSQHYRPPPAAKAPSLLTQPLEFPSDAVASELIPDDYDPLAEDDSMPPMRTPAQRSASRSALHGRPAVRGRSQADFPAPAGARAPRDLDASRGPDSDLPVAGLGSQFGDVPDLRGAPASRGASGSRGAPLPREAPAARGGSVPRGAPDGRGGSIPRGGSDVRGAPLPRGGPDDPAPREAQPAARTTAPFPSSGQAEPNRAAVSERRSERAGSRASDLDFAALLAGAGLEAARVSPELAEQFGQIMHVVVAGLMDVLQARGKIKDEFRLRLTSFKQRDNNPLKFSANVEDALHNILVKRNTAYLGPVEAFEDAFQDVRNHQMAMLAGMRVAYDAMLAEFDPQRLQKEFDEQLKAKSFLSGSAKQRYWELYCTRFRDMVKDADSCFRRLFGDEFAKAYEEQLARLRMLKRPDRQ